MRKRGREVNNDPQGARIKKMNDFMSSIVPMNRHMIDDIRENCIHDMNDGCSLSCEQTNLMSLIRKCDELESENKKLRIKLMNVVGAIVDEY